MLDAVSGEVPAPMEALVRMTARTMATDGVTVTVPPAAPASDSVVSETVWVAVMVSAPAPVSGGPRVGSATGLMPAYTMWVGRFKAIAAPMPTVPSPDWVALADALSELFDPAVMLTAPPPTITTPGRGPGPGNGELTGSASRWASVFSVAMFSANAAATPSVPLVSEAPASAIASSVWVPALFISAVIVRPDACSAEPTPTPASV